MRLKRVIKIFLTGGGLGAAIKAMGGAWVVAFMVFGTVVVVGGTMYLVHRWYVKWEDIQKHRQQQMEDASTNQTEAVVVPPSPDGNTNLANLTVIDRRHYLFIEEDPSAAPPPLLSVSATRVLHPVVKAILATNGIVLSVTNDGYWVTSSVSLVNKDGTPREDLDGSLPEKEVTFYLQRSRNMETWETVVYMGTSSNDPGLFRDEGVTWGYPHVFYRALVIGR